MATGDNNIKKTVLMDVQMDTTSATSAVNELGNAVKAVGDNPIGTQSVTSYKKAIKEAQKELEILGRTKGINSQEFVNAAKNVQNLKNDFEELQIASDALNSENKLRGLATVAKGATGALMSVSGAMTFLGVESDNAAVLMAKMQGLLVFSQGLDSIFDMMDGFNSLLRMLGLNIVATNSQSAANTGQAATSAAVTTATVAQTVATESATVATQGLGLAMKALGIGLIIGAVALLVTYWDDIKIAMNSILPAGKSVSNMFNNIKSMAMGVGNSISQFIAQPFKAVAALLRGDLDGFKKAITEGLNFKANFNAGFQKQELITTEAHNKEVFKKQLVNDERHLERLKNQGKNVESQELALAKRKLSSLEKGTAEYAAQQKKIEDLQDAHIKNVAAKTKAANDKLSAAQKSASDKVILAKKEELKKLQDTEADYYTKLSEDNKLAKAYLEEENLKALSKFDRDLAEIEKKRKDFNDRVGVSDEDKLKINDIAKTQTEEIKTKRDLTDANNSAQTNLINTEVSNAPSDSDTPEIAKQKVLNINAEKRLAEIASFNLKKLDLVGQQSEIASLTASHNQALLDIEADSTKAKIELTEKEKEAKLDNLTTVGGALQGINSIISENTVAAKGINIATAIMDTYAGASKALAQGGMFGYIGAAGVIAAGLGNVRKIMSVKVPKDKTTIPNMSAPLINSTVLNQANSGIRDLRKDVSTSKDTPQVVKAFIVEKDLNTKQQRSEFLNRLGSI